MSCCTNGLSEMFSEDVSRSDADAYRKHGLPKRARKLLAAIQATTPLAGKQTLEIGVGVGAVSIELLRHGAATAVGVDAVASQLDQARILAQEKGVADRLELVLSDFTQTNQVPQADVVVLDRVVCCYPDWRALLTGAATHARVAVALTYPRAVWWVKALWWIADTWAKYTRDGFRLFIHTPQRMHELLASQGFVPKVVGRYYWWDIVIAARPG